MKKNKINTIIIALIISLNMIACNSDDVNNPSKPNPPIESGDAINKVDKNPQMTENRVLEKDKDEIFNYEGGNYSIRLIEAKKYNNINNTSSMNNWVTVEYQYKNMNISKGIEVNPKSFEVMDQGDTALEFSTMYENEESPKELAKGEEKTVRMVYKAEKPVTDVRIVFKGIENKDPLGKIQIPVIN